MLVTSVSNKKMASRRRQAVLPNPHNLPEVDTRHDPLQDLYVFGYQCTVFRDDEKAELIDEGKHLIPWMEDECIMMDRYYQREREATPSIKCQNIWGSYSLDGYIHFTII